MLSDVWCMFDVCLSRTSGLCREQRPRKTKITTEVAHVTRDSDTTFKVKRSKVEVTRPLYSPRRLRIRQLRWWPWERIHRGREPTATLRSGAVGSAARGASAPTEEGEGRGILWRLPHSLFITCLRCWLPLAKYGSRAASATEVLSGRALEGPTRPVVAVEKWVWSVTKLMQWQISSSVVQRHQIKSNKSNFFLKWPK